MLNNNFKLEKLEELQEKGLITSKVVKQIEKIVYKNVEQLCNDLFDEVEEEKHNELQEILFVNLNKDRG